MNDNTSSVLVLLSGGLDSSTALALMKSDPERRVEAIFVDYRQRHLREEKSSIAIAKHYDVPWSRLDLRTFGESVRSALTSIGEIEVPHGHYAADNMALTVVPNRNATLLSAAAGIAASRGLSAVVTAVHAGDHTVYPDCRPEFISAISAATILGCGVSVAAPFLYASKADIAAKAFELGMPIEQTWSCYEGGDIHCGRCGTCVERAEALADPMSARLGVDPTLYADEKFWRQAVGASA